MSAVAFPDLTSEQLLPGERADLRSDVIELLGESWLRASNVCFGFRSAESLIGTADEGRVRDVLRSLSVSALS